LILSVLRLHDFLSDSLTLSLTRSLTPWPRGFSTCWNLDSACSVTDTTTSRHPDSPRRQSCPLSDSMTLWNASDTVAPFATRKRKTTPLASRPLQHPPLTITAIFGTHARQIGALQPRSSEMTVELAHKDYCSGACSVFVLYPQLVLFHAKKHKEGLDAKKRLPFRIPSFLFFGKLISTSNFLHFPISRNGL